MGVCECSVVVDREGRGEGEGETEGGSEEGGNSCFIHLLSHFAVTHSHTESQAVGSVFEDG